MRIVLDLQACQASNCKRGIGRYSMSLATHVAKLAAVRGHDLRIVLSNRFPDSIEAIRHAFNKLVPREHITVFDVPAGLAGADPSNDWRMRAAEQLREHYLAGLRPDIVHVASLFEGWGDDAIASLRQGASTPGLSAVTLYDLIPLVRRKDYLGNPRMRDWYYRKLRSLKSADLLLAISGHSRDEAISELNLPAERVINISSAIDDAFGPRTLTSEQGNALRQRYGISRAFLMYTGGIDPRKNIEKLIEAFARLPAALRTSHQLAIVCNVSDAERKRLTGLAQSVGLKRDALLLTGYVPDTDLILLYNLASAFVFPSLHEGFGLPALEAMACGTPVIGSNTSSIPEVIGRADALFDPTDVAAMSAKIAQVLTDEDMRTSLRNHGLEQAHRFSWDASAERTLNGFEQLYERRRASAAVAKQTSAKARPRLAFLSPLPPDKSGIADYSADLIAELVTDYDIHVIAQTLIEDPWILANCKVRSIAWFEQHGDEFDRIIYHFGNSSFHEHMFALLSRFPGTVVLHDFFLSGIINYIDHLNQVPHALVHALYDSHGYAALLTQKREGRIPSVWAYPCNRQVLNDAAGIIVHSRFAQQLAQSWYGANAGSDWVVMAFPRQLGHAERQAARQRLGVDNNTYLVCTFGLLGASKLNDRLLDAWLSSPMAQDPQCRLVFVGENEPGTYGASIKKTIDDSGCDTRVTITGFAPRALYLDYLAAADCAVQLRGNSRGETSAAIMDCLAYGVPTIVNANGSAAELPETVLMKIADDFTQDMLRDALMLLYNKPSMARAFSEQARNYVATQHNPYRIGHRYCEVIEQFSHTSPAATRRRLIRDLGRIEVSVPPEDNDWAAVADALVRNGPAPLGPRQLLVDVSELVQRDAKSGIQRVVRNVLEILLNEPPAGYRVEPIYESGGHYRYARRFTCQMLGLDNCPLEDNLLETWAGDRYLGLDLLPHGVPQNAQFFDDLRHRGVELFYVVYDLLPVLRPDVFPPHADAIFGRWLESISRLADGLVCISRAVADELALWLAHHPPARKTALKIDYFHLGADICPPVDSNTDMVEPHAVLTAMQKAPSILMVGTLEPRKGHAQALSAFERLWADSSKANLVIVGKNGWMVDTVTKRIRTHPEIGKRLFWVEGASDALLTQLYTAASALLAASEGEGFGLPLIEAAQHGLPIIARDLPVFIEVAGEHAFYFTGTSAESLAARLAEWLALHADRKEPPSTGMTWLNWKQSTQNLIETLNKHEWYLNVSPEGV